jgi:hypothetical protein
VLLNASSASFSVSMLFSVEVQAVLDVESNPVGKVTIAKLVTILPHQMISHLEFVVIDSFHYAVDCCFDFHHLLLCVAVYV